MQHSPARPLAVALAVGALVLSLICTGIAFTVMLWPEPAAPPASQQVKVAIPVNGAVKGLAIDQRGNLYLTAGARVLKLLPDAVAAPIELPFPELSNSLAGVAVDAAGTVYVAEWRGNARVFKLPPGADAPIQLPFPGLVGPVGIAADPSGSVFVADYRDHDTGTVLKLAAGADRPTELPFDEPDQPLRSPWSIGADAAGNVYVATTDGRTLKLAAGADRPTALPLNGLGWKYPQGITADKSGNVYLGTELGVLELATGAAHPTVLPFVGLNGPTGVAVDADGNIYALNSVMPEPMLLKLPPR